MPRALLVILAVALVVRLAVVVGTRDFVPTGDPADYDRIAVWLADGNRFAPTAIAEPGGSSAFRPPAFPLALGAIYKAVGRRYTIARGIMALLGTATVLLLYLLVARVFDRRLALWSAGIAAIAPPLVWINATLLSESLFLPVMLAIALCVALFRERERWWLAVAAGLLVGVAASTRTTGIMLALPVALGLARHHRFVALACTALVLVPWTVRNASEFGRFLPLGTQGGFTMAAQWNELSGAPGKFHAIVILPQNVPATAGLFRKPGIDEGDLDAALRKRARTYAADHPGHVADAIALNTLRSVALGPGHSLTSETSYKEMNVPRGLWWTLDLSIWLLTALAIAGLILRLKPPLWLWSMPVVIFVAGIAWPGNPRHALPLYLFMIVPAAFALIRAKAASESAFARTAGASS